MTGKQTPIDTHELLEIMDNDISLLKECFDDFLNDYSEMLYLIKTAIDDADTDALQRHAHALKGSLKYLAAGPASDIAGQLEDYGKSGHLEEALSVFDSLQAECERLREFMIDY